MLFQAKTRGKGGARARDKVRQVDGMPGYLRPKPPLRDPVHQLQTKVVV
jgi:hypothetical protein